MPEQPERVRTGNLRCSICTVSDFVDDIKRLLCDREISPRTYLFINAYVYCLASQDRELHAALEASRITAADGMSICWTAQLFGTRLPERCNMTEAFRAFINDEAVPNCSALLIGATPEEAGLAAHAVNSRQDRCRIAKAVSGFLEKSDYEQLLSGSGDADLILVGMSSPKSEEICSLAASLCPNAIVWHIGGGTIKFLAGTAKEAPVLLRRLGLQWLHRLCAEPGRMWKRYLIGNIRFLLLVLRARLRRHS